LFITLCCKYTCYSDNEDTPYNPTLILDIEEKLPHKLLEQNSMGVRCLTTTNPEETMPLKSNWKNKEILL
jgi:hypothetical protein